MTQIAADVASGRPSDGEQLELDGDRSLGRDVVEQREEFEVVRRLNPEIAKGKSSSSLCYFLTASAGEVCPAPSGASQSDAPRRTNSAWKSRTVWSTVLQDHELSTS
jgi:hypothetical protein